MKVLCVIFSFLMSLHIWGAEGFAVVESSSIPLVTDQGYIVDNLNKGKLVKISKVSESKKKVLIEFDGALYWSRLEYFRVINSIIDEEIQLLKKIQELDIKSNELEGQILQKSKLVDKKFEKASRLQRWIEVQRDMAFSVDYFLARTKKTLTLKKKLDREIDLLKLERDMLIEEKESMKIILKEKQNLLRSIKVSKKSLKAEKSSFSPKSANAANELKLKS